MSNHQNALLDILLIATHCSKKPYFLARADIFKNRFFRPFFGFLQMLPVYRLRDGKASLSKNEAIFNRCGELLNQGEAILLFPEANHSLKRRVRPLSKGFTRLLFNAWKLNPDMDIQIVPIGQNYQTPTELGDRTALYFGTPIRVRDFMDVSEKKTADNIKAEVEKRLQALTTHIDDGIASKAIINQLELHHVDYTYPKKINSFLDGEVKIGSLPKHQSNKSASMLKAIIYLLNLPVVFLWRILLKPKVRELEFMATFRFGFSMVLFPVFYGLTLIVLAYAYNIKTACLVVIGHAVLNLILIKIGVVTSSAQRK